MHFFPPNNLTQSFKPKSQLKFCNLLIGQTYHNSKYLYDCHLMQESSTDRVSTNFSKATSQSDRTLSHQNHPTTKASNVKDIHNYKNCNKFSLREVSHRNQNKVRNSSLYEILNNPQDCIQLSTKARRYLEDKTIDQGGRTIDQSKKTIDQAGKAIDQGGKTNGDKLLNIQKGSIKIIPNQRNHVINSVGQNHHRKDQKPYSRNIQSAYCYNTNHKNHRNHANNTNSISNQVKNEEKQSIRASAIIKPKKTQITILKQKASFNQHKGSEKQSYALDLNKQKQGYGQQKILQKDQVFQFPEIKIFLLNKIENFQDLQKECIKCSLEQVFEECFKKQIMGVLTNQFIQKIMVYLKQIHNSSTTRLQILCEDQEKIKQQNRKHLHENMKESSMDPNLLKIFKKSDLLVKIMELQECLDYQTIFKLIKYYCIPSFSQNEILLNKLIKKLTIQSYEKKNNSRDAQYVLMLQNGRQVINLTEIGFMTKRMFFVQKKSQAKTFLKYLNILEEKNNAFKLSFNQEIKLNFRKNNQIDQQQAVFTEDNILRQEIRIQDQTIKNEFVKRKNTIQIAQQMIQTKSSMKKMTRTKNASNTNKKSYLFDQSLIFDNKNERSKRLYERRKLRHEKHRRMLKKLEQILNPFRSFNTTTNIDEEIRKSFKALHQQNERFDITYNQAHEESLLIENFKENCDFIKKKTSLQKDKIIATISKIYRNRSNSKDLNQITYMEYKEMYRVAHGIGSKQNIIRFVGEYLEIIEFNEITRLDFKNVMHHAINRNGRKQRIIENIMWSFFEENKLIQNNSLKRNLLEIWYEPVQIVYLLFLSIIFGEEFQESDIFII